MLKCAKRHGAASMALSHYKGMKREIDWYRFLIINICARMVKWQMYNVSVHWLSREKPDAALAEIGCPHALLK